jgi:hypothetical protein
VVVRCIGVLFSVAIISLRTIVPTTLWIRVVFKFGGAWITTEIDGIAAM